MRCRLTERSAFSYRRNLRNEMAGRAGQGARHGDGLRGGIGAGIGSAEQGGYTAGQGSRGCSSMSWRACGSMRGESSPLEISRLVSMPSKNEDLIRLGGDLACGHRLATSSAHRRGRACNRG